MTKKIGILTFHATVNYGALLQAYALYKQIQQLGYDANFIDYRPLMAQRVDFKYLFFRGRYLLNPLQIPQGSQRLRKTGQFIKNRLPTSKLRYLNPQSLSKNEPAYNAVVCGSDEIWNTNSPIVGCDLSYFLNFVSVPKTQKVSYAASFGGTTELKPSSLKEKINNLLQDFDAISVRDENSMRLVREAGQSVTKVLDPTFLIDYNDILTRPNRQKEYVLVYGCLSAEEGAFVDQAAKRAGLDIVAVGCQQRDWRPAHNYIGISPEDWLGYFASASYIFTKFYHGTIFSVIFRKPFNTFYNPGKAVKVKDLLGDLDLRDRLLSGNLSNIESFTLDWDVNWNLDRLNEMINHSRAFLENALKGGGE